MALALDATSVGGPVCRLDRQCGVSGLCHPRGLDRLAGQPARGMAAGMAAHAAAGAPRHPGGLDGAGAGRPRACGRAGSSCGLSAWAGIPCCGSTRAPSFARQARRAGIGCASWCASVGQSWRGRGTAFVSSERRLACTLVAWWGEGYTDPWFLLTDLAPEGCDAAWYGLRGWCEQGFKCFKRGGWQWQYTQMSAPDRAARLWLALAVATLWMVSVGGALEVGPRPRPRSCPICGPCWGPPWRRQAARAASGCCAWAGCGAWCVRSPREACPCRSASSQSPGPIYRWGYWWLLSIRTPWNTMRYEKVYPQKGAAAPQTRWPPVWPMRLAAGPFPPVRAHGTPGHHGRGRGASPGARPGSPRPLRGTAQALASTGANFGADPWTRGAGAPRRWCPVPPALAAGRPALVGTTAAGRAYRGPVAFLDPLRTLDPLLPAWHGGHHSN